MIKVFLVEDEFAMRERMKNNINWEQNGFTLVGDAGDGELAYSMILQLKPDILITDIQMPFMNGLELARLLKENMPKMKIIILSGYDKFEYAKEAIQLGVIDYLLKPITSKKILESLNQVATIIETERYQEAHYERCQIQQEEKVQLAKKEFFNSLLLNRESVQSLIAKGKELGIDLTAIGYNILLLKISFLENESLNQEADLKRSLNHYFSIQKNLLIFERDSGDYTILFKNDNQKLINLEESIINSLTDILKKYQSIEYFIGIGERVSRISKIPQSYESATQALAYRYFINNTQVFYYDKLKEYTSLSTIENIHLSELGILKIDKTQLENFLYDGSIEGIPSFIENYFNALQPNLNSYMFCQYLVMDIYFTMLSFYKKINAPMETIELLFENDQKVGLILQDQEILKKTIESWFMECFKVRDSEICKGYSKVIAQVKHYLQENYNKEGLSLNQVGEFVNISPSHLSTLFSQETGQTFISYLTHIRMEKAKELLRCTNMKTLEIGYEVGYKDAHYFSSLFKKTQNCTPKEYRRKIYELD